MALSLGAVLILARFALPTPPERIRPTESTDDDLRQFLRGTLAAADTSQNPDLVALGEALFRDPNILTGGRSCEGCHASGGADTRFTETDRRAPDLARSRFYQRFGVDGRAPDMESFIASHLESRSELSIGRVRFTRSILAHHARTYERAFSAPPPLPLDSLPEDGSPSLDMREFPVTVSSYILETLADRNLLRAILSQAQTEHLAPAVIVNKMVFLPRMPDSQRTESFYRLPRDVQEQITGVFDNSIRALVAYIKQLPIAESAFDRFAKRVTAGEVPDKTTNTEFGADELAGLRLFHGPAGCARCHHGPGLTDSQFHNIGLPASDRLDAGRAAGLVLDDHHEPCVADIALPPSPFPSAPLCPTPEEVTAGMITAVGAFRTPSLRVAQASRALTHNGQIEDYDAMLTFYSRLNDRPAIGRRNIALVPLMLTNEETAALRAFLASINDGKAVLGSIQKAPSNAP